MKGGSVIKVLIINYEYPPIGAGAATFTQYLAFGLSNKNCKICVLTSRYGEISEYERISDNLEIFRTYMFRKSFCQATKRGILTYLFSSFFSINKVIKKFKPDLCLNFFGFPCGPLALYIKKKYNIPYILCLRGGDVPGFSPEETEVYHKLLSPINYAVWNNATTITANSEGLKNLAFKFYNKQKIKVIYNGIDTDIYKPLSNRISSDEIKILFAGRIVAQKNLMFYVEEVISDVLKQSQKKIVFTILGDGPLKKDLLEICNKKNIEKNVEFIDWIPREKLSELYNSHDIFAFPSLYEGMSNVVMEAKACGLPIVAYDIAGIKEILEPAKDLIVEIDNKKMFIESILKMIDSCKYKERIVTDNFKCKFSMDKITNKFYELLENALE